MITANTLSYDLSNENETPLAKMDRDIILKISKGLIPVESSTIDFIFHLSPYVDIDKKININMQQLRDEMQCRKSTFEFALAQALQLGLITLKGNDYFSEIHIVTTGVGGNYTYIPNLKILTSPLFKNYTLNQKRLFLYFLASRPPGLKHAVAIRNLYNNSLHNPGVGVDYFRSYREVVGTIIKMVESGHIGVEVTKSVGNEEVKKYFKQYSQSVDTRKEILKFLEIEESKKGQKWVYKEDELNLKISVHILHDSRKDIRKVTSSEQEIYNLCEAFEVPIYHLENHEAWRYIIAYKNYLYNQVGQKGISIYRESLANFFKDSAPLMEYYLQIDKVANYFMDFHLLKNCINDVISYAHALQDKTMSLHEKKLVKENMRNLLVFINKYGSDADLLILEQEIANHDAMLEDLFNSIWLETKNKINAFVNKQYINHVVSRQLELTIDQYKRELLNVIYNNRSKQYTILEDKLEKLAFRIKNSNERLKNLQLITNYMNNLQQIKDASLNGESFIKDAVTSKPANPVASYNWLENK
ncbi:hypothetical protein M3603_15165 [Rummeliibacillus stabekisii]|uniref:hypothetical protein n=1 Tax=Rummeliibacillus stabekisii TaxID=241244 RepID=UPI0020402354|nr:hypothetical protein [Rummeliibacillus stabekisii]MCM3317957.1 hypothetical protein [Rummeliibacillus stabekisii]